MAVTTTTQIDPTIQPFLQYGLQQAQQLYQAGGPQYYPNQAFVAPTEATQTGLQALEARATQGNPLLGQAQGALGQTLGGAFLGGNPFFQGAFAPAAQAATRQFQTAIGDIESRASLAGRYGSGAMGNLQDRATGALAQSLANTAGNLAYQNYEAERARQNAAIAAAPAMAQADYQDIQNMLQAGQLREGYMGQQLQADINRFNFLQNRPQQNLANYMSAVYGNPLTGQTMQTQRGSSANDLQNLLGTAATLAGIERNTGWLSSGWNRLFG